MADYKEIIQNIENIYGSNNSLNMIKDFERVIDELDIYVFDNWMDGELASGPHEHRYFVECTFMWPKDKMPDPKGGLRLLDYNCKVQFAESTIAKVRRIKKPGDIRPGTRKGKIDREDIWMVKISMPKKLMADINRGYKNLDKNKVEDILTQNNAPAVIAAAGAAVTQPPGQENAEQPAE